MLGPFEVRLDDGACAEVPDARLRGLLAALALEPGHVVPNATLVDWIWGERPPAEAAEEAPREGIVYIRSVTYTTLGPDRGSATEQSYGYRVPAAQVPDGLAVLPLDGVLEQVGQPAAGGEAGDVGDPATGPDRDDESLVV